MSNDPELHENRGQVAVTPDDKGSIHIAFKGGLMLQGDDPEQAELVAEMIRVASPVHGTLLEEFYLAENASDDELLAIGRLLIYFALLKGTEEGTIEETKEKLQALADGSLPKSGSGVDNIISAIGLTFDD